MNGKEIKEVRRRLFMEIKWCATKPPSQLLDAIMKEIKEAYRKGYVEGNRDAYCVDDMKVGRDWLKNVDKSDWV